MNTSNYKKGAHVLIFNNKGEILLAKILKNTHNKGRYTNPGGKQETNEKIINCLKREVFEETGLLFNTQNFELLDCYIYDEKKAKSFMFKTEFRFSSGKLENKEPAKHSDWQWFSIKDALKLDLLQSLRYYLEYNY